jgi:co-chaperonin GroES (HSP10)
MQAQETKPVAAALKDAPKVFSPFGDRILLQRVKPEEVTAGGIFLPKSREENDKLFVSVVIVVGPDVDGIRPGDWVVHLPYACEQIVINGHQFEVARQEDLLGGLE